MTPFQSWRSKPLEPFLTFSVSHNLLPIWCRACCLYLQNRALCCHSVNMEGHYPLCFPAQLPASASVPVSLFSIQLYSYIVDLWSCYSVLRYHVFSEVLGDFLIPLKVKTKPYRPVRLCFWPWLLFWTPLLLLSCLLLSYTDVPPVWGSLCLRTFALAV